MCRWYEAHLDAQDEAWAATPEGREAVQRWEQEEARVVAEVARLRAETVAREQRLRRQYPRVWAEWKRVRVLWDVPAIDMTDPTARPFGFEDFLIEVGRPEPSDRRVVRRDKSRPYQPGNLRWEPTTAKQSNALYMTYRQVGREFGIPKTKLYELRKAKKVEYVKVPGVGYRFIRSSLERLVKDHTVATETPTKAPAKLTPAERRPARKTAPPAGPRFKYL